MTRIDPCRSSDGDHPNDVANMRAAIPADAPGLPSTRRWLLAAGALLAGGALWQGLPSAFALSEAAVLLPPPGRDLQAGSGMQTAVLAGGCFWGVQGVFQHVEGVASAVSGYAGGDQVSAVYGAVGSGRTGHAEAVRIRYDPRRISYGRILQIYFSVAHDPTQRNRQGPDIGPQYRSAVFPQDAEQALVARAYIAQLDAARLFPAPLATTIEMGNAFYPAEAYHQDYMAHNPSDGYIVAFDRPKLDNLRRVFPEHYRETPVLVGTGT